MKRWLSTLLSLLFVATLAVATPACSKPPETPQSKRIAEIDAELKDLDSKMAKESPGSDEYQKMADKKIELNAERSNIIQKADANRRE